jgi:hypothetical protein
MENAGSNLTASSPMTNGNLPNVRALVDLPIEPHDTSVSDAPDDNAYSLIDPPIEFGYDISSHEIPDENIYTLTDLLIERYDTSSDDTPNERHYNPFNGSATTRSNNPFGSRGTRTCRACQTRKGVKILHRNELG